MWQVTGGLAVSYRCCAEQVTGATAFVTRRVTVSPRGRTASIPGSVGMHAVFSVRPGDDACGVGEGSLGREDARLAGRGLGDQQGAVPKLPLSAGAPAPDLARGVDRAHGRP